MKKISKFWAASSRLLCFPLKRGRVHKGIKAETMDNKKSSEFLGPKHIFEEHKEGQLTHILEMDSDEKLKMIRDIVHVSTEEAREAKREYEKELRETEIESRKIREMTGEEVLVYFKVIKPLKKREKPLTTSELLSKLETMLQLEFISSCERELAKTRNHIERAEGEEDAPLMNDQRKKECLDPEEVRKQFDLCHRRMHKVNANIGFNGSEYCDPETDLFPFSVHDGPIEID